MRHVKQEKMWKKVLFMLCFIPANSFSHG